MKARIRIPLREKRQLDTLHKALEPETHRAASTRSRVNLRIAGDSLVLDVEATDTAALRAALNSYLGWINSTINVLDALDNT